MNENKEVVNPTVIDIENTKDDVVVDVALQYNDSYSENLLSFVNNINTVDGGTHLSGFRAALTRTDVYKRQEYDQWRMEILAIWCARSFY